ncbi:ABC transporter substrate-binding protein [Cohnella sp. AR92]|uniref:ABC transporter substrate-binding protein n=1 Tax=Cohnella sp. AR92 TaxID=648716 RepID=UPI000F8D4EB0|nr:ABC transporter substrate-binding protein [Cohnella sp. AR92]RUS46555.1 extracellular solute-binding protein [Cohnella sp. AR92]
MAQQRKWPVVLMSATLVAGLLAGCGNKNDNNGSSASPSGSASSSASNSPEALKPLTLSFYSEDPSPNWTNMQDDVGKEITAKTGITLDAEFAVGDAVQKSALIASSGKYPDLISPKTSISKFVDAGAVIDLTDLIDKYGPNIKKVYGDQLKRLRYSNDDHAIYVLPTYDGVGKTYFNAGGGFELQHRVVKELGYPQIKTLQDYENAIKAYLEKHPTDENGNKNIGLTLNADDWHMYISVTNPAFQATGGSDDGEYHITDDGKTVTYHFLRPEEKDYFKWLNHMNAEGLLDPESFVQKYDQYKAKIATGRVLGLIDQDWDYGDGENALKAEGKFDQGYAHFSVTLNDTIKDRTFQSTGFMAGSGVAISKTNPDPIRTIKFLDYLASDEGQVLVNWGIEGKHYNVVDGKRVIPEDVQKKKYNDTTNFVKETGLSNVGGLYPLLAPHYGDGVKDPSGNYYTTVFPDQIVAGFNDVEKETLKAYNATTWKDLFPNESEFPVKPWGAAWNIPIPSDSEITVLDEKLKTITWKMIPKAILAKPEEFDGIWDDYVKQLEKAGVHKAEELRAQTVADRVKLWNE